MFLKKCLSVEEQSFSQHVSEKAFFLIKQECVSLPACRPPQTLYQSLLAVTQGIRPTFTWGILYLLCLTDLSTSKEHLLCRQGSCCCKITTSVPELPLPLHSSRCFVRGLFLRNCCSQRQESFLDKRQVGLKKRPFRTVPPLLDSGLVLVPLLQGGRPVVLKPTGPHDLKEGTNVKGPFGRLHSE